MSPAELGLLDRDAFVTRLGGIAEGSPWVAAQAWDRRPFADQAALQNAFRRAIEDASPERQLALIRAHPDLAGRAALAGELTKESQREQASTGLDRLTPDELATFTRLNQEYRDRFGFPFVVCVAEHTKESILEAYASRLAHDPDTERRAAVGEVAKIVGLRLAALS
jgi:OHCU decarboxylase